MDLLQTATPKKLVRHKGTWRLEVERLVHIDEQILRPMRKSLVGEEAILHHLEHSTEGRAFYGAASRVLRQARALQEDCIFEAQDGNWVPRNPSPTEDVTFGPEPEQPAAAFAEALRTEAASLKAVNARLVETLRKLEERVAALEATTTTP